MKLPVSVVILTLNEADRMKRCLSSLGPASQVVILDSYSQDQTLDVAKHVWLELGRDLSDLHLLTQNWKGFTQTRNESLNFVNQEWVLWVDADEWVEDGLWKDLERLILSQPQASVFEIPRLSYFLGRAIRHGGWYPDRKARFAKRSDCEWKSGPHGSDVHEDLLPKGPAAREHLKTRFHLFHEGFRSVEEQFQTNDRYSTLLAEGLAKKWKEKKCSSPTDFYIALKVGIKFIENFIWKMGFLDGYPGFLIAQGSAQSMKMRLQKAKNFFERAAHGS